MKPEDLVWVVNGPENLGIPKAARTQIRKQVMKAAVEARRHKQRREHEAESRGEEVENHDREPRSEKITGAVGRMTGEIVRQFAKNRGQRFGSDIVLPLSLPSTGIEVLIIDHGLDRQTAVSMLYVQAILPFEFRLSDWMLIQQAGYPGVASTLKPWHRAT